jgi:hypothetical protein
MKKSTLITAAFILLAAGTSFAQDQIGARYDKAMKNHPIRFGIKAGPSFSNLKVENAGGNVYDKQPIATGHVAAYVDIPLLPAFSIQTGLQLGMKGARFTVGDNSTGTYTEVNTRPVYLEIPLNAVVKLPIGNKLNVNLGAGPYIAAGVGGKNKLEGKLLGVSYSDDKSIHYNSDNNSSSYNSDLKRFDAGLNFLAGVEISHFTLNANYGHGLSNIKSGSDNNNMKFSNRVVSISFGVLF